VAREGFTNCPNEVLEALMVAGDITRAESQIILTVARFSYGFRRETAPTSITFLERSTNLPRRTVRRCLASLQEKKVLALKGKERIRGKGPKVLAWKINHPKMWQVCTVASPVGEKVCTPLSPLDQQVCAVKPPLNDPSVHTGDRQVCTVASPKKEREEIPNTEEAAFLLQSRFFSKDKKILGDPQSFIDAWKDARPDLDLLHQLRKAEAFLVSTC